MNSAVKAYRDDTASLMLCFPLRRRRLLAELDDCINIYLSDNPEPAYGDLVAALGSPYELAAAISQEVSPMERQYFTQKSRTRKTTFSALAAVMALALVIFSVYTFFVKENNIVYVTDSGSGFTYTEVLHVGERQEIDPDDMNYYLSLFTEE